MNNPVEEWTAIAVLVRPRGNKGELVAESLSSRPGRFAALSTVYLFGSGDPIEVERVWEHDGVPIFKFKGIDSISDAEKLRGAEIRIPKSERIELEPGEFFQSDLIGFEVHDRQSGRLIGKITGWQEYGGPALLEVDEGRLLIPFVQAICTEIDSQRRSVLVDLPEGLEALASE